LRFNPRRNRIVFYRTSVNAFALPDFNPGLIEHVAAFLNEVVAVVSGQQRFATGMLQEPVH
jgi:hypothetical protein